MISSLMGIRQIAFSVQLKFYLSIITSYLRSKMFHLILNKT